MDFLRQSSAACHQHFHQLLVLNTCIRYRYAKSCLMTFTKTLLWNNHSWFHHAWIVSFSYKSKRFQCSYHSKLTWQEGFYYTYSNLKSVQLQVISWSTFGTTWPKYPHCSYCIVFTESPSYRLRVQEGSFTLQGKVPYDKLFFSLLNSCLCASPTIFFNLFIRLFPSIALFLFLCRQCIGLSSSLEFLSLHLPYSISLKSNHPTTLSALSLI